MKGVIFANQGAEPKVVDTLERPIPGPDQLLVKSIFVAINPVYVAQSSVASRLPVFIDRWYL